MAKDSALITFGIRSAKRLEDYKLIRWPVGFVELEVSGEEGHALAMGVLTAPACSPESPTAKDSRRGAEALEASGYCLSVGSG